MTEITTIALTALRFLVLFLGIAITYTSYDAYRRHGVPYLRTASIGFGIITVGVFIEGVLYTLLDLDLVVVHIVESVAIAIGFIVLLYSFRQ